MFYSNPAGQITNDEGGSQTVINPQGNLLLAGREVNESKAILDVQTDDGFRATLINSAGNFLVGGCEVESAAPAIALKNSDGHIMRLFEPDGTLAHPSSGDEDWYQRYHAENMAISASLASELQTTIPALDAGITQFIEIGQSISTGQECWPVKTTAPLTDALMLGASCRPVNLGGGGTWESVGGQDVLTPLVATAQTYSDKSVLLTLDEQAELPAGSPVQGENPAVGTLHLLRKMWLARRCVSSDPDHRWVLTSCGIPGRNLNCLMNSSDWYRVPESARKIKSIADSEKTTAKLGAIFLTHGEYDSAGINNASYLAKKTRSDYLEGLKQYITKIRQEVGRDIYNMPDWEYIPVFLNQAGGIYTNDETKLGVLMAQIDIVNELPNIYLFGSYSFMPDKGNHLHPNSSRWLGQFAAKSVANVLLNQRRSFPCVIRNAIAKNKQLIVNVLSPAYPIITGDAWDKTALKHHSDFGFTVYQDSVRLNIINAKILSPSQILLEFADNLSGKIELFYADKKYHSAVGNIFDSDNTKSVFRYEYQAGSGDYADADIESLVDKLYPLNNPLLASYINVEIL